ASRACRTSSSVGSAWAPGTTRKDTSSTPSAARARPAATGLVTVRVSRLTPHRGPDRAYSHQSHKRTPVTRMLSGHICHTSHMSHSHLDVCVPDGETAVPRLEPGDLRSTHVLPNVPLTCARSECPNPGRLPRGVQAEGVP